MKRGTKSLLLLAALLVLLGSYGAVGRLSQQAEVSEEAGSFGLFERTAGEISAISWTNAGTEYCFIRGEDGWERRDDAAFPVKQQAIEDMAQRLVSMQASRRLTGVESMADYGFGEDSFAITAEWSDGASTRCILGDETPFADGWYLRIDGEDGVVYTAKASLEAMFAETDIDLAELEEIGGVENAASLQIGDDLRLVRRAEGGFDPGQRWFSADGEPMDDAAVDELISTIEALKWQELYLVSATEEQLAGLGLEDGSATLVSLHGEDGDGMDIYIGASDAVGDRYARLPGSHMVYTLDGDSTAAILASDADALWSSAIFTLDYENLRQFSCLLNGENRLYQPSESASEDTQEAAESNETDEIEALWQQICTLQATARSDAEADGEALLTITAVNLDGAEQACGFYGWDVDSYLAVIDDGRALLVPADDVDRLIRCLLH